MRIGIHTSTSGALANAARTAHELGANCFQIFTASPRMWRSTPVALQAVHDLAAARDEFDLAPLVVHAGYLINLASADPLIRSRSVAAFRQELERCAAIQADYLVMHPGSARGQSTEEALVRLAAALAEAAAGVRAPGLTLLFENTAGAGATLGRTLEELRALRDLAAPKLPFPTGYCLDTCHLLASGYDIVNGLRRVTQQVGTTLGWDHVGVIHANDSQGELGSHRDRHANIGEGHIGQEGFRRILHQPQWRKKAFILETPVEQEGDDRKNVDTLKTLWRIKH